MTRAVAEPNTDYNGPFSGLTVPYRKGVKTYDGPVHSSPEDLLIYRYALENPGLYLHEVNIGPWLLPGSDLAHGAFNRRIDAVRIPDLSTAHRWLNDGPDLIPVLHGTSRIEIIESKRRLDKASDSANVIGELILALDLLDSLLPKLGASTEVLPPVVCCEKADVVVRRALSSHCNGARVVEYGQLRPAW